MTISAAAWIGLALVRARKGARCTLFIVISDIAPTPLSLPGLSRQSRLVEHIARLAGITGTRRHSVSKTRVNALMAPAR